MADYIRKVSYVVLVEIREGPGEHCWGKLYEPVDDNGEEEDEEWLNALAQANSFMGAGHVNEAKR